MGIFKAYDVRGIYGENLTEKEAFLFGYYLARYLKLNLFKVGHDLRLSHETLTKFFLRGLIEASCKPIYVGAVSTPNFYFSLFDRVSSGCIITASHNSKEYNGFKVINNLSSFDSRNGLYDVGKLVEEDLDSKGKIFDQIFQNLNKISLKDFLISESIEISNILEPYVSYLEKFARNLFTKEELDILKIRRFGFCFSGGMSSQALVPLVKNLEINHLFFLDEIDPEFKSYDPEPRNAQDYVAFNIEAVETTFVYDGDGDRVFVYDEEEELVLEDLFIFSLVDYFAKHDKNNFVVDLRASKSLFDFAESKNLNLEMMRVGRAFYQDYMKDKNCIFGAELSGHLFFEEFNYFDNPDIATLYFLKILSQKFIHDSNFRVSSLFNSISPYFKLPETNLKVSDSKESLSFLEDKFKENVVSKMDGVSIKFEDFWFNVRGSNTEPVIRINLEATSLDVANNEMDKLKDLLK